MIGVGEARAFGAVTVVNAIATGRGAALSVDLWTDAKVELTNSPGVIEGVIKNDPQESPTLIEKTVETILNFFKLKRKYGANIETDSIIPIAKGLKSSSSAANAVALATVAALGKKLSDPAIINLGVDAALAAKVTATGAFDDACASYLGNLVVTDNINRKILKRFKIRGNYAVLILVPKEKVYTANVNINKTKLISTLVDLALRETLSGNYWLALTLNGLAYSAALGYNTDPVLSALSAGALAAGLSGKGPSIAAVVPLHKVNFVKKAWELYPGEIVTANINHEKAFVKRIQS
ncbi:shikimate kinase [Candidatus Bathyarchaeota archaeon]|nr:shikimate kinase [Candidatus Bathyarchaeota archaeon]